jgi:hypothetical protein
MRVNRLRRHPALYTATPPKEAHMIRKMPGYRVAALVGAAAIASLSLAACGGDDKAEADANEISVLSDHTANDANAKAFKAMTDKFTAQTGIKVNTENVNNTDIAKTYEASKLANKEKDIVALNLSAASSGWLKGGQVVSILNFIGFWNEYLYALIIVGTNPDIRTVQVALPTLVGSQGVTDYAVVCAGTVISVLPVFLVYILLNRRMENALVQGALKG